MIKKLTSFLIVTIFLFCITCCKVNISEEKNPFMPVIVPEMVKVSGGIIEGKDYPWAPPKGNFPKGRRVKLSDFYIGKYEVTQEEYYSVMKDEVVYVTAYVDGIGERTAEFFMDSRPSVLPKVNLDFFIKANKVV